MDSQKGLFKPLFYTWLQSFVPILVILLSIINRGDNLKEKQSYKKIWALPVRNFSFEFLPFQVAKWTRILQLNNCINSLDVIKKGELLNINMFNLKCNISADLEIYLICIF